MSMIDGKEISMDPTSGVQEPTIFMQDTESPIHGELFENLQEVIEQRYVSKLSDLAGVLKTIPESLGDELISTAAFNAVPTILLSHMDEEELLNNPNIQDIGVALELDITMFEWESNSPLFLASSYGFALVRTIVPDCVTNQKSATVPKAKWDKYGAKISVNVTSILDNLYDLYTISLSTHPSENFLNQRLSRLIKSGKGEELDQFVNLVRFFGENIDLLLKQITLK